MLAMLARRDVCRGFPFEPQGSPRRIGRMLAFRLVGR
jgi:hypothetical protein